ncbi:MAG: NAD(P)H-hydrate dehydratase [Ruminococcaceae bacterium]|nr:NAD(P)H-hydrate dehydratase [Oscillospiraceae bacterium]
MKIGIGMCQYDEIKKYRNLISDFDLDNIQTCCKVISVIFACIDAFSGEITKDDIYINCDDVINAKVNYQNFEYIAQIKIIEKNETLISCVCFDVDEKKFLYKKVILSKQDDNNFVMSTNYMKSVFPKRYPKSHKGTYGKCFVVAGSKMLTGAAHFAANACVKCGSGLVSLGYPSSLHNVFESLTKEVMTLPLEDIDGTFSKECIGKIFTKCKNSDVLIYGCGIGTNEDIDYITKSIIDNVEIPIVIDADGINSLSRNIDVLKNHKQQLILTPHFMEFSRLTNIPISKIEENPIQYALDFSKKYNVVLVLKSEKTIVVSCDKPVWINPLGNPGMATGGTGDVLAGVIASFVGQGLSCYNAAVLGTFMHSLSGDMSSLEKGMHSMTPSDILDNLPYAIKNFVSEE